MNEIDPGPTCPPTASKPVEAARATAVDVTEQSGAWSRDFSLASADTVRITLRYRMEFARQYESDECSQVLVSLDGLLVGRGPGAGEQPGCVGASSTQDHPNGGGIDDLDG